MLRLYLEPVLIKRLLTRQVPAARLFAGIGMLALVIFAGPSLWHWAITPAPPPAQIQDADRALVATVLSQGWISASPVLEPTEEPTAYAAPSPWGAAAATLYIGRVEQGAWPDPKTAAWFREFAVLHELAHIELEATRPQATKSQLRPLADLLHVAPETFWVQVFDEAHADWQAGVILWRRHGAAADPFLRQLVQWRKGHSLFGPLDPHQQVDLLTPWLDAMTDPSQQAPWQGSTVPVLRQRIFDEALAVAVDWLILHPDDQSDLFQGTQLRPLFDRPPTPARRAHAELIQYGQAHARLKTAPHAPRDSSPSQAVRWLWDLAPDQAGPWRDLAYQSDGVWRQERRREARAALESMGGVPSALLEAARATSPAPSPGSRRSD